MRVLHIIDSLETGGSEASLVGLAPLLLDLGCDYQVAPLRSGPLRALLEDRVQVHSVTGKTRMGQLMGLVRLVTHTQPDLLYTTLFWANQLGRITGLLTRTPVLGAFVADSYSASRRMNNPNLSASKMAVVRVVDMLTARIPVHFLAVSESIKQANCRHLRISESKVSVIARGRDLTRFQVPASGRDYLRVALGYLPVGPIILTVGRLAAVKGQEFLIRAMPSVLAAHPGALLLIAGEGPLRAHLEQVIHDCGLSQSVVLLGYRDDIPELLHAADVFTLPSLSEGAAGAIVEAMMAGTPVVASDSPSIRECLGSDTNGFLVPAGDTVALGAALVYVMNHREEAQRMGLSAADVARKKYDLAQKAAETCRAFRVSVDQAQMVRVPNRYKRSGPG